MKAGMRAVIGSSALGLAVAAAAAGSVASRTNRPPHATTNSSIPAIARLAGIAVGDATQEDLARRWGEGKTTIGGHPNSGRVWRIKGTDWELSTDGFDYSERGLVVDSLDLGIVPQSKADVPFARLPKSDFTWLGGIRLGMSRSAVQEILKKKSLVATGAAQKLTIKASGYHQLQNGRLETWLVDLHFKTNVLTNLSIAAYEGKTK